MNLPTPTNSTIFLRHDSEKFSQSFVFLLFCSLESQMTIKDICRVSTIKVLCAGLNSIKKQVVVMIRICSGRMPLKVKVTGIYTLCYI